MAITRNGLRLSAAVTGGATSVAGTTVTAAITVGEQFIVGVVTKNVATADGVSTTHTSVADNATSSTNVYTKLGEYTNAPSAAVEVGVCVSVWLCRVTTAMPIGTTVTAQLGASIIDRGIFGDAYAVSAGNMLQLTGSPTNTEVTAANGFGSAVISGLSSAARLYFRAMGKEAASTTAITATTNFTSLGIALRSRNNAAAVCPRGEFRLNTSTGETSNPTMAVSGDTASVFVALSEVAIPQSQAPRTMAHFRRMWS
jgi:hypothetical protein